MSQNVITRFIDSLHRAFRAGDDDAAAKVVEAENVRRLQELYRAIARGDFAAVGDALTEDVEMELLAPPEYGFVSGAQGREQVLSAMQENFAKVEDQRPKVVLLAAQGNKVVVTARETGRRRSSGRPYDLRWVQCYEFRDGKIARIRELAADADPPRSNVVDEQR